ncbi:hypothetical protein BDP27DRAFT_1319445 [Rhodocollybia butyracea]|uniref:BTB domain-containing protein n=1 Tax=Rhodocollybia butyracea TaxID=206335 RepID=A0A9P5PVB5_9AGAR|nr:hypothetical protein BDP27DRAFT_1319445 [Rhodocollybia butyracea]
MSLSPSPLSYAGPFYNYHAAVIPDREKIAGTPDPDKLQRDASYYLPTKIFLVDNRLFQIPMHFLSSQSEVFKGMLEMPLPSDGAIEGMSDESPIHLEGVSKQDFRQLLRVLCPPKVIGRLEVLSFHEWLSVLKLADQWCMDAVRAHAIEMMTDIAVDPVEKVVVARKYSISHWIAPALNSILQRSQTLNEKDVGRLGLSTALRLVEIRERLKQDYSHMYLLHRGQGPAQLISHCHQRRRCQRS